MADITMSREVLECHLAAIDSRIEKSVTMLGFLDAYCEGDIAEMLKNSIEISVDMARAAQRAIERLKTEAGLSNDLPQT
jgi:uncharacterized protein Yka (UPF0111/DUF47 family)